MEAGGRPDDSTMHDIPLVTTQPTSFGSYPAHAGDISLMPIPKGIPVCPPGLEYLAMLDQILVHQKIELFEVLCGCETRNKYEIKNSLGQIFYTAEEDTGWCNRNCWGAMRPFDLRIKDSNEREVISIYRELRCNCCCCPCCLQKMIVYSPPGVVVGTIEQEWSFLRPNFRVDDAAGNTVFRITGPLCVIKCCSDIDFPVLATNGEEIGKITKQWSGLTREIFTDADHFGITFPINLDVTLKALLLGACFLIDFNYFETSGDSTLGALV